MKRILFGLLLVFSGILGVPLFPQSRGRTVISSGRVNTLGKFSFQYGILEASIKVPKTADGLHPVLWLLGSDYSEGSRPGGGEITILEMGHQRGIEDGAQDRFFSAAARWGAMEEDGSYPNYTVYKTNLYGLQHGDFHLFTLVWDEHRIRIYLDRDRLPVSSSEERTLPGAFPPEGSPKIPPDMKPYFEMAITPELRRYFCKPFFIGINLAAGGGVTNILTIDGVSALNRGNSNQASLYIDYIRVYDGAGTLVFGDEFNLPRIDAQKWNIEENNGAEENQGLQRYRRRNVQIDKERISGKSCLVISARKETAN
ncbi:MAG: family 16 glycosylhydrolase [Spirochaetaceae bacterium]|jgi:beta-glucanase (GH16 family)|nr:family 16 glycosylhydrolase [Spirochaetaceae bacterium]